MAAILIYLEFFVEMIILGFYTVNVALRRILFIPGRPKNLKNEIILVTGGADGIGREICRQICNYETDLTLISWDINGPGNDDLVRELRGLGLHRVYAFTVDVSNEEEVEIAAKRTRDEIGDVTILVNNAGIAGPLEEAWKAEPAQIEKVIRVNFLSQCWMLRAFLPNMINRKKGHVVTLCSILGFTAGPLGSAYVASKHAVKGYMESVKEDLRRSSGGSNIKVTVAFPHNTVTNLTSKVNLRAGKYGFLFPQLKPQLVASKIVDGLLLEEEYVYVPGYVRLYHMVMNFLPPEVVRRSIDIADVRETTDLKLS